MTFRVYRVSDNSRFVAALVVALAAHAALLASIDFPRYAAPETAPFAHDHPGRLPATASPDSHPRPRRGARCPGRTSNTIGTPPPPLPVEPPSPAPQPSRPLAGRTAVDLARDIVALDSTATVHANPSPRVHRLLAGTTTTPEFAYYLEAWRRKVERIGKLNYPQEARSRGLSGSLRLLVTITAEGTLRDVRVLETSGHRILDEAALHIVRLAAPYAPFSPKCVQPPTSSRSSGRGISETAVTLLKEARVKQ